jgi:glycosyltransferase involved in cell wall biosynthesis
LTKAQAFGAILIRMNMPSLKISVAIPCFNEGPSIELFLADINRIAEQMTPHATFEFLFIDDGSTDDTLENLRQASAKDPRVRYLSFSRNFGKEAALVAGLQHVTGDLIAVMDADLQDPPALLPEMFARLQADPTLECVAARRVTRKNEPWLRSFGAHTFYRLMARISKTPPVDGARDFRLMRRRMVDAILQLTERSRFSKGLFNWVGFKKEWIEYENVERAAGKTSWSLWGLATYSVEGIVNFSTAPLLIVSWFGIASFVGAIMMMCYVIARTLLYGDPVAGWPSLTTIVLLLGGVQLLSIGILGQYIARMFIEVKERPLYLIAESNMVQSKDD